MDERIIIQVLLALDLQRRNISHDRIKKLVVSHASLLREVIERMNEKELHAKVEELKTKIYDLLEV